MKLVSIGKLLALAIVSAGAQSALGSNAATIEGQAAASAATLDSGAVITAVLSQPGTVTNAGGTKTYSNWSFLVNDGTGSLDVFGHMPTGSTYTPTVGDAITATGTYSPFDQIPELATLTAISPSSSGNAVPAPLLMTISQVNLVPSVDSAMPFTVAGQLLAINDVTISGISGIFSTTNLTGTITDSSSNSMTLFYWESSYSMAFQNLGGTTIPTGPVDLVGFAYVFGSGATAVTEFSPITITPEVPEPTSLGLLTLAGMGLLAGRSRR